MTALRLWGPVLVYLAVISILSHQPSLAPPGGAPDWLLHFVEYAGLGALLARAGIGSGFAPGPATVAWGAAACAALGILDEWHQSFVPGRHATLGDAAVDAAGAAAAIVAWAAAASRARALPVEIRLFGRRECHLCDEAERILKDVSSAYRVRLQKIDVDEDETLRRRYGDEVPVVTVGGRKLFKYRVDPERLRRVLDSMQRRIST